MQNNDYLCTNQPFFIMNRTQLTDAVARSLQVSKAQAGRCINAVLGAIADNLTDGDHEVAIPDFGRFFVKMQRCTRDLRQLSDAAESESFFRAFRMAFSGTLIAFHDNTSLARLYHNLR